MSYSVDIVCVDTGELRTWSTPRPWPGEFQYSEGNDACDCNRAILFARAAGEAPPVNPPCGSALYRIPRAVLDTGEVVPIDSL